MSFQSFSIQTLSPSFLRRCLYFKAHSSWLLLLIPDCVYFDIKKNCGVKYICWTFICKVKIVRKKYLQTSFHARKYSYFIDYFHLMSLLVSHSFVQHTKVICMHKSNSTEYWTKKKCDKRRIFRIEKNIICVVLLKSHHDYEEWGMRRVIYKLKFTEFRI